MNGTRRTDAFEAAPNQSDLSKCPREQKGAQNALRRFVPKLLTRLDAPHRVIDDNLLEVEIPAQLAAELAGPMARPEHLLLAFDEARARQVEGAEWLTPSSARFKEWTELVRRRGRVARSTAVAVNLDRAPSLTRRPHHPFPFEPWFSVGLTFTPFAGAAATGQQFEEWIVNLALGTAFPCDISGLERRLKSELLAARGMLDTPDLEWREGLPPKGSVTVRRRLSMRKAYRIVCREILNRASSARAHDAAQDGGQIEASPPAEVHVRPYRAAILYLPRLSMFGTEPI